MAMSGLVLPHPAKFYHIWDSTVYLKSSQHSNICTICHIRYYFKYWPVSGQFFS